MPSSRSFIVEVSEFNGPEGEMVLCLHLVLAGRNGPEAYFPISELLLNRISEPFIISIFRDYAGHIRS